MSTQGLNKQQLKQVAECGRIPIAKTLILAWLEKNDDRDFWVSVRERNLEMIRMCQAANEAIEDKYDLKPGRKRKTNK